MVNSVNWLTRYTQSVHYGRQELDCRYQRNAMQAMFERGCPRWGTQTTISYDCGIPDAAMIGVGISCGINFLARLTRFIFPQVFR